MARRPRLMPLVPWFIAAGMLFRAGPLLAAPEEAAVADEVVTEEPVEAVEATATSGAWAARPIEPRQMDGQMVYVRHSSDAFNDPDQRMSLEAKYYFRLPLPDSAAPPPDGLVDLQDKQIAAAAATPELKRLAAALAKADSPSRAQCAKWLDANSLKPKLLVVLETAGSPTDDAQATLSVVRVKSDRDKLALEKLSARLHFAQAELIDSKRAGAIFATWDFPKDLAGKSLFLNRLVAVLKHIDGRYCVDFHGTNLNADADCRLWLMSEHDPLGEPVAIHFVDIPIRKESGNVAPVSVLAVTLRGRDGSLTQIALDFPLCRPAMMEQMQKLAAAPKPDANAREPQSQAKSPPPDVAKIVGEDLLEEFARRLVNGTYR